MKNFYCVWIVFGLIVGSAQAMDQEPGLILDLLWRFGKVDFGSMCSLSLACKVVRNSILSFSEKRRVELKASYDSLIKKHEFDYGALLTVHSTGCACGFIGVKVLLEGSCAHDDNCEVSLWCLKLLYSGSEPIYSFNTFKINKTWCNPEPRWQKYPWIENFKNSTIRPLEYEQAGATLQGEWYRIKLEKPFFNAEGDLKALVYSANTNKKHEYLIRRDGHKFRDGEKQ